MNAVTETRPARSIERADATSSIFLVTGPEGLSIKEGTIVSLGGRSYPFDADTPVEIVGVVAGSDYVVRMVEGRAEAIPAERSDVDADSTIGGFHFAGSGNATARAGGDGLAQINALSCWDIGFRPSCPDPRGMTLVDMPGKRFWADIYLLGVDHLDGTSKCSVTIADGRDLPVRPDGEGKYKRLDYATAAEVYAFHGKGLLGAEEFFGFAYGTTERESRDDDPKITGLLDNGGAKFVSRCGGFDVTGTMWQWGTDGDPDNPRASLFGGSWLSGSLSGSRYAILDNWAGNSDGDISARGRSDHLSPA